MNPFSKIFVPTALTLSFCAAAPFVHAQSLTSPNTISGQSASKVEASVKAQLILNALKKKPANISKIDALKSAITQILGENTADLADVAAALVVAGDPGLSVSDIVSAAVSIDPSAAVSVVQSVSTALVVSAGENIDLTALQNTINNEVIQAAAEASGGEVDIATIQTAAVTGVTAGLQTAAIPAQANASPTATRVVLSAQDTVPTVEIVTNDQGGITITVAPPSGSEPNVITPPGEQSPSV